MDRPLARKIKKDFKQNKSFKNDWISWSIKMNGFFMSVEEIFSRFIPTIFSVYSVVSVKLTPEGANRRLSPRCKPNLFKDLMGRDGGKEICFINK